MLFFFLYFSNVPAASVHLQVSHTCLCDDASLEELVTVAEEDGSDFIQPTNQQFSI